MNELITWNTPFSDLFRRMEAIMNYDYDKESRGLKNIKRPHTLYVKKDDAGNIISYGIDVVYTPFSKKDIIVEVLNGVLTVTCGNENLEKDDTAVFSSISRQSYNFSLLLSDNINADAITAKADDGILHITIPVKKNEEKTDTPKVIDIQ